MPELLKNLLQEEDKLLHKELSYKLIGLAMKVHSGLGGGFLERVYENALAVLLRKEAINFQQQYPLKVYFESEVVGEYLADIIIDEKIILELKVADAITSIHKAQAINYLKANRLQLAIILNFGKQSLQYERVVNYAKIRMIKYFISRKFVKFVVKGYQISLSINNSYVSLFLINSTSPFSPIKIAAGKGRPL